MEERTHEPVGVGRAAHLAEGACGDVLADRREEKERDEAEEAECSEPCDGGAAIGPEPETLFGCMA